MPGVTKKVLDRFQGSSSMTDKGYREGLREASETQKKS